LSTEIERTTANIISSGVNALPILISRSDRWEGELPRRLFRLVLRSANATTIGGIDAAFATLASDRPDALFVAPDAFFASHRVQLANLAAREVIPTIYSNRDYVTAGGFYSGMEFRCPCFTSNASGHLFDPTMEFRSARPAATRQLIWLGLWCGFSD
jgi:hypothetical protein